MRKIQLEIRLLRRLMAGLWFFALPAWAQLNYQPYPVGERSGGMGGAYTALANDEAGAFYNPAGTAFAEGDSLSLSTSFYGLITGTYAGALGAGHDFSYTNLNLFPTTASTLWHLGESSPGKPARWVLTFGIFSPGNYQLDQRADVNGGGTTLFLGITEKTLLPGISLAYRASERFSVGAAVFGQYHTLTERADLTDSRPSQQAGFNNFIQVTSSREQSNLGVLGSLGARVALTESLFLGLCVRSPSFELAGSGKSFTRAAFGNADTGSTNLLTSTDAVSTLRLIPARISVGLAEVKARQHALSMDVSVYAPIAYQSMSSLLKPEVNQFADHGLVVDLSVGGEYYVSPTLALRGGLYTDFAPAAEPSPLNANSSEEQVQFVGATFSGSVVSERTSSTLGLVAGLGLVHVLGLDLTQGRYDAVVSSGTEWRLFIVWSSSFTY